MRISDGSSDVCSSDLAASKYVEPRHGEFFAFEALLLLVVAAMSLSSVRHLFHAAVEHLTMKHDLAQLARFDPLSRSSSSIVKNPTCSRMAIHIPIAVGVSGAGRSEEHTSELQSLMRTSYAVFCLKKKKTKKQK